MQMFIDGRPCRVLSLRTAQPGSASGSALSSTPTSAAPLVSTLNLTRRVHDQCCQSNSSSSRQVLLVSSSRRPDHWIVPGGGVEPEEEASVTAIREVQEEAGVIGKLGRCLGVFENCEQKHRTEVFVMTVTEELPEWEDSRSIGRKRKWFTMEDALTQLSLHKPGQLTYLQSLLTCRNEKVT
ncbi:Diphosphoinositol polyphosphate phosphohydrolase 1 [Frankliniella fusca]|uniref:diphosphoinositol-polyphosphate diphosphatase n=1 Tax=Frankliniella fusca TaxID=407009 RepID=A0AAE1HZ72_9NEOP|nr:Diphosphoinositol polyphosphate phosphohydrolase 1 [Frankliniella fusca]